MAYGVGSSMFNGSYDFTADVVGLMVNGAWTEQAKVGRRLRPNDRLETVSV